jgi:urea transport system ATP-binding protein
MQRTVLTVEKATVNFDGFIALDRLNFTLNEGELHLVIGPNGAGKTTLLDVISGKVKPVKGRVRFLKHFDLAHSQEHHIVRLGVARKFQTPSVFANLTVYQNLELAAGYRENVLKLLYPLPMEQREKIQTVLAMVNLTPKADFLAGRLAHGEKQWLEIAMLLIQKPKVLLLDEPVAGMTAKERKQTGQLLRNICQDMSVIVVEHDMEFVKEFATKVTVLHEGKTLSEGTSAEVQRDPLVIQAYLGRGTRKRIVA